MPKKKIPKPEYWTDFEDLCLRLWSEAWNYPETKKNGRNGQRQQGVDIYGRAAPSGGIIGIQCKGKDEYSHKQLSTKEIDAEIASAKQFRPALEKFYIATTANRSAAIDEYIRLKDQQHRDESLFEVHWYAWEDICDLLEQHKTTLDWYLNHRGFQTRAHACLVFDNGLEEIRLRPEFQEEITRYADVSLLKLLGWENLLEQTKSRLSYLFPELNQIHTLEEYLVYLNKDYELPDEEDRRPQPVEYFLEQLVREASRQNLSVSVIRLKLVNTGTVQLKNFKVYLTFKNILRADTVDKNRKFLDLAKYSYNVIFREGHPITAEYLPKETVLVQNDHLELDQIAFSTNGKPLTATIDWRLVAKGYENSGQLKMNIRPKKEVLRNIKYVESPKDHPTKKRLFNKYKY